MNAFTLPDFYSWTATGLLHGTVLALLTWLLSATLLRRSRPPVLAALWTVVLLKFLLPPMLPGRFALSSLLPSFPASAAESLPAGTVTAMPILTNTAAATTASWWQEMAQIVPVSPWSWIAILYLTGALWMSLRAVWRWFGLRRSLSRLPQADDPLSEVTQGLAQRLGINRSIRILLSPESPTPFVFGLFRPQLVLPVDLMGQIGAEAREALLVHELAHIRRGDLVVRWLQNLARILLFFWPPVWWVCRRIDRASEMACDQWAVAVSNVQPHLYARSLLDVAKSMGESKSGLRQPAFADGGRHLEERFEMILDNSSARSPRLPWIALLLLALWAGFAWAGGAPEPQEKEKAKKTTVVHRIGAEDSESKDRVFGEAEKAEILLRVTEKLRWLQDNPEAELDGNAKFRILFGTSAGLLTRTREKMLETHPEADLDGDGDLSKVEMKSFLEKERVAAKLRMFEEHPEADLDGDGSVSGVEMQTYHSAGMRSRLAEKFPDADLDGDGTLSDEEARGVKEQFSTLHLRDGSNSFVLRREDQNEDGEASATVEFGALLRTDEPTEWRLGSADSLAEADADGDGSVSTEEIESYMASKGIRFRFSTDENGGNVQFHAKRIDSDDAGGEGSELHVVENEKLNYGVWVAKEDPNPETRRMSILKQHPEADLDGDGTLSDEESRDFAAKVAREAKQRKKVRKDN